MKKKIFLLLSSLLISGLFFSCRSIKEIPEEKTAAQIIQMGQNAALSNLFTDAEFCYKTAIERYADDNTTVIQAKYELGHIYTKQKKYDKALKEFNYILEQAEVNPKSVPPKYVKLCNMGLETINEALEDE